MPQRWLHRQMPLSSYYSENQSSYDAPLLRQFDAIILDPEQLEAEITISDAALQEALSCA